METEGLPDDADYELHEDYIMWRHWTAVAGKAAMETDYET